MAPSARPSPSPTIPPSPFPTKVPTLPPTLTPSLSPSFHAPTPAPTYECRPSWAIENGHSHCFRDSQELGGVGAPYGWYNGIFHLEEVVTLDLFVEPTTPGETCTYGERVGTVSFQYNNKVVTVEFETIGDFYMTETQGKKEECLWIPYPATNPDAHISSQ